MYTSKRTTGGLLTGWPGHYQEKQIGVGSCQCRRRGMLGEKRCADHARSGDRHLLEVEGKQISGSVVGGWRGRKTERARGCC